MKKIFTILLFTLPAFLLAQTQVTDYQVISKSPIDYKILGKSGNKIFVWADKPEGADEILVKEISGNKFKVFYKLKNEEWINSFDFSGKTKFISVFDSDHRHILKLKIDNSGFEKIKLPDNSFEVYSLEDKLFFTNNKKLFLLEKVKYLYQFKIFKNEYSLIQKLNDNQILIKYNDYTVGIIGSNLKEKTINPGVQFNGIYFENDQLVFFTPVEIVIYDIQYNIISKKKVNFYEEPKNAYFKVFTDKNYIISIGYKFKLHNYYTIEPNFIVSKSFISEDRLMVLNDSGYVTRGEISIDGGPTNFKDVSNFLSIGSEVYFLSFIDGNSSSKGLFLKVLDHEQFKIRSYKISDSLFSSHSYYGKQQIGSLLHADNQLVVFSNSSPQPLALYDITKKELVKSDIKTQNYVGSINQNETSFLVKEGESILEYDLSAKTKNTLLNENISKWESGIKKHFKVAGDLIFLVEKPDKSSFWATIKDNNLHILLNTNIFSNAFNLYANWEIDKFRNLLVFQIGEEIKGFEYDNRKKLFTEINIGKGNYFGEVGKYYDKFWFWRDSQLLSIDENLKLNFGKKFVGYAKILNIFENNDVLYSTDASLNYFSSDSQKDSKLSDGYTEILNIEKDKVIYKAGRKIMQFIPSTGALTVSYSFPNNFYDVMSTSKFRLIGDYYSFDYKIIANQTGQIYDFEKDYMPYKVIEGNFLFYVKNNINKIYILNLKTQSKKSIDLPKYPIQTSLIVCNDTFALIRIDKEVYSINLLPNDLKLSPLDLDENSIQSNIGSLYLFSDSDKSELVIFDIKTGKIVRHKLNLSGFGFNQYLSKKMENIYQLIFNNGSSLRSLILNENLELITESTGEYSYITQNPIIGFHGKEYFINTDPFFGPETWTSDGTSAGTHVFSDIFSGENGSSPQQIFVNDGKLYALATGNSSGLQIWELNSEQKLEKEETQILVFPNPVENVFSIYSSKVGMGFNFNIFDSNGKIYKKEKFYKNGQSFDANYFPSGLYFLKSEDGQFSQKILIVK